MADEENVVNGASQVRNDVNDVNEKAVVLASPVAEGYAAGNFPQERLTGWLVLTAITCFLGSSFQFGYNLGVINAPKDVSFHTFHSLHYFLLLFTFLFAIWKSKTS